MKDIRYPDICGRCAENPALLWRRFTHSKTHYTSIVTNVGRIRTTHYYYYVPICEKCGSKLTFYKQLGIFLTFIFIALITLLCLVVLKDEPLTDSLWISLVFGIMSGGIMGFALYTLIMQVMGNAKFSSFNGKYFKFTNPAYQEQFAALNPTYVSRKADSSTPLPATFNFTRAMQEYVQVLLMELKAGKPPAAVKRRISEVGFYKKDKQWIEQALEKYLGSEAKP